jgi:hypothetical protein
VQAFTAVKTGNFHWVFSIYNNNNNNNQITSSQVLSLHKQTSLPKVDANPIFSFTTSLPKKN